MRKIPGGRSRPFLAVALALAGTAVPAFAQDADTRLRRLEAEVRDLRRQAGVAGTVAPQAVPGAAPTRIPGTPASTPVADLLGRMEAIESQLARLTALSEENGNRLRQLEERVTANEASRGAVAAASAQTAEPAASDSPADLAMSGSSAAPPRAVTPVAAAAAPARQTPAPARAATPPADRVAAVRAIVKPQTSDAGDDEYSYGFRLWDAKFYPEAQQQLKLFLDKYPRHSRVSFARNLMGRALLDDGKPREAASWFLQNYQADKQGDRAPDSLLFLAQSMGELKDSSRACIALGEFADTYPDEAAGRLKSQYEAVRGSVKCN